MAAAGLALASPASHWPNLPALVAELQHRGFAPELLKTGRESSSAWQSLLRPRSAESDESSDSSYAYVLNLKRWSKSRSWGLVFFESSLQPTAQDLAHTNFAIKTQAPDAALDFVLRRLALPEWSGQGEPIPDGVSAERGVVVGAGTLIGPGTVLEAGVRIGAHCRIGSDCRIGAHSRIGDGCQLGDRVTLTGQVSVGGQGFGFVKAPGKSAGSPRLHVGGVRIGDDVRLGAFVAVDRGVFEDTVIGPRTALDNHVQIAHNCVLGADDVLCGFVGLSGSTVLGDGVTLAGLVGTKGHLRIGHGVTVAAQSGVTSDLPDHSGVWKGYPPRPLAEALKNQVLVEKLPEFLERLRKLEKT